MPEINLLKKPSSDNSQALPKILEGVFIVALILLVLYYGFLYFQSKKADQDAATAQIKISQVTEQALTAPGRSELITRQQQLQNLATLISSHVYWSQILAPLAADTLKTATYSNLQISPGGILTLTATVPSINDLDTYLQVFDLPQVYKNFSNVKITSFSKVQNLNSSSIQFEVTMNYNPALINYVPPTGTSVRSGN